MANEVENYLDGVIQKYKTRQTTEHSFRGELQKFFEDTVKGIQAINEPRRQKCGAPDYIVQKKSIPIGYIEAKDIDKNLDMFENSEQLERYRASLDNLILTNYIEFRFFINGEKVDTVKIAEIQNGKIKPDKNTFPVLLNHIRNFCDYHGQTVKSPKQLANLIAQKAVMIRDVIIKSLEYDSETSLKSQLDAFKQVLLHDLTNHTFADMYAQTIAYGLFVARLNDTTLEDFSRQEARELVSKNNPFLRQLFDYISGANLDDNLVWIVDDLVEIFRAVDLHKLLYNYGKDTQMTDPFLHFYETFLASYDKVTKEKRGVFYTPQPVVRFIVSSVDSLLKSEFNLAHGLADDSTIKHTRILYHKQKKVKNKVIDAPVTTEEDVYKVQILDPATGTGTFLAEAIRKIYSYFVNQKGLWSQYVDKALIPRLNGFEIMMTPYVMCHLKLDLLLKETGYETTKTTNRFNVYLTNALEKDETTKYPLLDWLSEEARQAGMIKSDKPIMVVMGNPPYSISSCNKSDYIDEMMSVYKKDLNEKNIQPLSDDYIKFISMGENYIEKNNEGILAYISNNSFLDGVIHRQMRKHLMQTFDKIYILNLHGNSKKKEAAPDGSKDENVFDIQQGVSINIFIKSSAKAKKQSAKVYYAEIFGLRNQKYEFLNNHELKTTNYKELQPLEPYYFFVPKDFEAQADYEKGFKIDELFLISTSGVKTHHDNELVSMQPFNTDNNKKYYYKPFDNRYINYDLNKVVRHRYNVMKNFTPGTNLGLVLMRNLVNTSIYNTVLISNTLVDINFYGFQSYVFQLYLYDDNAQQKSFFENTRKPNLNMDIVHNFEQRSGLIFMPEKDESKGTFAPIDIFDYIYGILYSDKYRNKYKEFLKIDFPRVPYPKNAEYFFNIAKYGKQLRQLHLMETPELDNLITTYPESGTNEVVKPEYKGNKVYINKIQYFGDVPELAWNFCIGGYQPAQKWLKDRKGKILSYDEILYYQKIVLALVKTDELMRRIDEIIKL
ncbi:MAG: type ISP restriction/modification enzyme [Cyanobacteriota bacterium]|nr:type ISP restriction/modification enzyme [Cyanobacteriota bacterium]